MAKTKKSVNENEVSENKEELSFIEPTKKRGRPAKSEATKQKRTYTKRAVNDDATVKITLPRSPRAAYELGLSVGSAQAR